MFEIRLFWGLIMLVMTSKAQLHPGNSADGTCMDCSDTVIESAVFYTVCTENFTCPNGIADIEHAIKGKEILFNTTLYLGNAQFVPGTQHYAVIAIPESQIDTMEADDLGTVWVPTDNCQRCEVLIGDIWCKLVCKMVDCPPLVAKYIGIKPTVPEMDTTRDRVCLVSREDEYYIKTCYWFSDDPNIVDNIIQASA